jgi:hypothetical protein
MTSPNPQSNNQYEIDARLPVSPAYRREVEQFAMYLSDRKKRSWMRLAWMPRSF